MKAIDKRKGLLSSGVAGRQIEGREAVAECDCSLWFDNFGHARSSIFLHDLAIAVDFAHHAVVPSLQLPELKYQLVDRQASYSFPLSIGVVLAAFSPPPLIT